MKNKQNKIDPRTKKEILVLYLILLFGMVLISILSLYISINQTSNEFIYSMIEASITIAGFGLIAFTIKPDKIYDVWFLEDFFQVSKYSFIASILFFVYLGFKSSFFIFFGLIFLLGAIFLAIMMIYYYPSKIHHKL